MWVGGGVFYWDFKDRVNPRCNVTTWLLVVFACTVFLMYTHRVCLWEWHRRPFGNDMQEWLSSLNASSRVENEQSLRRFSFTIPQTFSMVDELRRCTKPWYKTRLSRAVCLNRVRGCMNYCADLEVLKKIIREFPYWPLEKCLFACRHWYGEIESVLS